MKVYESHHMDGRYRELDDVAETVCARYGTGGGNAPMVLECFTMDAIGQYSEGDVGSSCKQRDYKDATDIVCGIDCYCQTSTGDVAKTLCSAATDSDHIPGVSQNYIVRRLTPTECERLQGFPDGWTDIGEWTDTKGKKHKPADSPRYKALGNSIAIPPWLFVLSRLNEYCGEKTMASLFDGIGGFPLIWEFLNGNGSAVWCSEIEEFPIAVTKIRFPED